MHAANIDRFRSSQSICPSTSGTAGYVHAVDQPAGSVFLIPLNGVTEVKTTTEQPVRPRKEAPDSQNAEHGDCMVPQPGELDFTSPLQRETPDAAPTDDSDVERTGNQRKTTNAMTSISENTVQHPEPQQNGQPEEEMLSDDELAALANPKLQEDYRRAYLLQQARRSCPGCGEDHLTL